jgi:hypothetical protein
MPTGILCLKQGWLFNQFCFLIGFRLCKPSDHAPEPKPCLDIDKHLSNMPAFSEWEKSVSERVPDPYGDGTIQKLGIRVAGVIEGATSYLV